MTLFFHKKTFIKVKTEVTHLSLYHTKSLFRDSNFSMLDAGPEGFLWLLLLSVGQSIWPFSVMLFFFSHYIRK